VNRLVANRSEFPDRDVRSSLKQQAADSKSDITISAITVTQQAACKSCLAARPESNPEIRAAAKLADLVVIGTVLTRLSALTAHDGWVLTDSEIHVDELLKGEVDKRELSDGGSLSEITVTYPGGAVRTQGHSIVVRDGEFDLLTIGDKYVLFLKYIPQSRSYRQLPGMPGFDLSPKVVTSLSRLHSTQNGDLLINKSSWIAALRSSIEEGKTDSGGDDFDSKQRTLRSGHTRVICGRRSISIMSPFAREATVFSKGRIDGLLRS
jgi:hypothetical protein